jgi:hypothetical protein
VCVKNNFSLKSEKYTVDIYKILQVYGGVARNGIQVFASVTHFEDGMVGIIISCHLITLRTYRKSD